MWLTFGIGTTALALHLHVWRRAHHQTEGSRTSENEAFDSGHELLHTEHNALQIPISVEDRHSRCVVVNAAMTQFLNLPDTELIDRTDLDLLDPETALLHQREDGGHMRHHRQG